MGRNRDEWKAVYKGKKPYLDSWIQRYIPPRRDALVVDLGCGQGHMIQCLKEHGYTRVRGIDTSVGQVEAAHQENLREVARMDIAAYLKRHGASHDVVILLDVLEHLDRQELFHVLDWVAASMLPGGTLFLHVPNASGIFGLDMRYGDLTHENCFTEASISQCLLVCGFQDILCHEDPPVVHGLISLARMLVWKTLSAVFRLLYRAETGEPLKFATRNMLVTAKKAAAKAR
jgi:2-polyprenyl-3-methyl-5-hydroxy-6-metoxy-1,4-benzoquinol methylase